jgi:DNA-binding NarL/FixJ family response regulator
MGSMGATSVPVAAVRVFVVDDSAPWRHSVRSMLRRHAELRLIGEVADGLEAVQKARELNPDLILLDIGLPHLNGIEAAKQICQVVPSAKIVFLTLNGDAEVVRGALNSGGKGYVLKADAGRELWPAIEAVLQGKQFVSSGLDGRTQTDCSPILSN